MAWGDGINHQLNQHKNNMSKTKEHTDKIKLGIVGLGRAGWTLHLEPALAHGGYDIAAVADPLEERRKEAADKAGSKGFTSLQEMIEGMPDLDLIVIATPSLFHYDDIKKVLEAGKHCIAEKPISMNYQQAVELQKLAESKGLKIFINHAQLHMAEYPHLQSIIDSGVLGPIFNISTYWARFKRRWDWQTLRKNGGGELYNTGAHTLSVLLPLLGNPVKTVYSRMKVAHGIGDAEDHVEMSMETENNITANVLLSTAVHSTFPKWVICGKYGTATCDGTTTSIKYVPEDKMPDLSVLDSAAPERAYQWESLPWVEEERKVEPADTPNLQSNVYDVLTNGVSPVVTIESAVDVVRVTDLAYQSAGRE